MTSFFKSRRTAHIERLERFIASQDRLITESARNLCQLAENAASQDGRIASLEETVKIGLQHSQRINELERQSASQLRRIENLEGCIRTQAENQRVAAQELSRLAEQVSRAQSEAWRAMPLGPRLPEPLRPGPSPFWPMTPYSLDPCAFATMSTLPTVRVPDEGASS